MASLLPIAASMPGPRFRFARLAQSGPLTQPSKGNLAERGRRVAGGGHPPPALTEPDLWVAHPALRDAGVPRTQSQYSSVDGFLIHSYHRGNTSCLVAMRILIQKSLHCFSSDTSPRSLKYVLRSAWWAAGV